MIPFDITDWQSIPETEIRGERGVAKSKTLVLDSLVLRQVEYSSDYKADHWCDKGHVVYCIQGEFAIELKSGDKYSIKEGMTFQVSDNMSLHKLSTVSGAKVFILDGKFLEQ